MWNKSHPPSRYKAKSGKSKKNVDPDAKVFVLNNWHKMKEYVSLTTAAKKMCKRQWS